MQTVIRMLFKGLTTPTTDRSPSYGSILSGINRSLWRGRVQPPESLLNIEKKTKTKLNYLMLISNNIYRLMGTEQWEIAAQYSKMFRSPAKKESFRSSSWALKIRHFFF